jgi:hypothetical protein
VYECTLPADVTLQQATTIVRRFGNGWKVISDTSRLHGFDVMSPVYNTEHGFDIMQGVYEALSQLGCVPE